MYAFYSYICQSKLTYIRICAISIILLELIILVNNLKCDFINIYPLKCLQLIFSVVSSNLNYSLKEYFL